jgi:hypothetical protein
MSRASHLIARVNRNGPINDPMVPRSWDDPEDWPFSDRVWVITSLSRQDIQQRLAKRLHGDAVRVGWPQYPIESVEVPHGMQPVGVWWD